MTTGKKLALGGCVIAAATAYMAYLGAAASWQYYLTADECLADRAQFAGQRLRVSGKIAAGSLVIPADRRSASLALQGAAANLPVRYQGPLPEMLAENAEIVVEGRLQDDELLADKLITRCATKYRSQSPSPPEQVAEKPGTRL